MQPKLKIACNVPEVFLKHYNNASPPHSQAFSPPFLPPLPPLLTTPAAVGGRSLILVTRLVFAVDQRSREVFLPLPPGVEEATEPSKLIEQIQCTVG